MSPSDLQGCLAFIREAERLKNVRRSAYSSTGRQESTAEHTWRLCLLAMVLESEWKELDVLKILKLCVVHDLGEALHGDVPAVLQHLSPDKSAQERADLETLLHPLPSALAHTFMALWEEYENASSAEARIVKGLDKLETILQHNQGDNPVDFDYAFNLEYGRKYMAAHPVLQQIRALADANTLQRASIPSAPPQS